MTTPAYGLDLPRFHPSSEEDHFTVEAFVRRVEAFAANLQARTTLRPVVSPSSPTPTRAPVTTRTDPEFESGERPIQRDSRPSVDDDTLVSAGMRTG